jgi:shikimate dehydrogenase
MTTQLGVWGDPISHSRSPALHEAAYAVLGLDWTYSRRRVTSADLVANLAALDGSWRGLSLTMPLKEEAFRVAETHDHHADVTGAVNTLLLGARPQGFNTDVGGIIDALRERGVQNVGAVRILGAGATAASALVAASELGADHVDVRARDPRRAASLLAVADRVGLQCRVRRFDDPADAVDLTLATLPSGTALPGDVSARLAEEGGTLFDAAYAPWPSDLATAWEGQPVVSGLGMLLHQAVRQIRVFTQGDPQVALPDESAVVAAMRRALDSEDPA